MAGYESGCQKPSYYESAEDYGWPTAGKMSGGKEKGGAGKAGIQGMYLGGVAGKRPQQPWDQFSEDQYIHYDSEEESPEYSPAEPPEYIEADPDPVAGDNLPVMPIRGR